VVGVGEVLRGSDAAVMRLWECWRGLLRHGLPVARVLSPERRALLDRALGEWGFDEDALLLAIEGCAASAWCMGRNRSQRRFDDLGWILETAERIERLAAEGMLFRAWVAREAVDAAAQSADDWQPKSEDTAARLAAVRAAVLRRMGAR
jgi:hypothetical protein